MIRTIFILIIAYYSCTNNGGKLTINSDLKYISNDSLYPQNELKSLSCRQLSKEFNHYLGLKISKFYEIIDESVIDIDRDKIKDTLSILSPINKVPSNEICGNEIDASRILIIKTNNQVFIYDNIIWNKWGVGSHNADHIEVPCSDKGAFGLSNYFGQSCFFEYKLCLSMTKNRFMIDSILIRSGCEGKEFQKTINDFNKPFYIEDYKMNMIDSLMQKYSL